MMEDILKSQGYASKLEDMLRQHAKIDLVQKGFDYKAFLNELKAEANAPAEEVSEAPADSLSAGIARAEELAALSGKFHPDDLLPKRMAAATAQMILSRIAPSCSIDTTRKLQWQLNRQKRHEALLRMITTGALTTKLEGPLPPTDIYGDMLRRVLKEQTALPVKKLRQPEIIALSNALETLEGLPIPLPRLADVKALIKSPGILDQYTVISKDFIGRETELRTLHHFVFGNLQKGGWSGLVITGLGGVGKSTLLARFTEEVLAKQLAPVAILDFDRPGIVAADASWLTQEISRQIGEQYPAMKKLLAEARVDMRTSRETEGDGKSSISDSNEILRPLLKVVRAISTGFLAGWYSRKPLLLILDTMEEVVQSNDFHNLHNWLVWLAATMNPINIKVIFSGRLYDDQMKKLLAFSQIQNTPMVISEFDDTIAGQFLQKQGLSKVMTKKVLESGLLPLRPLELKLLARLLKEGKVSFSELSRELTQSKGKGRRSSKPLFTGIIYRRVLQRLSSQQVRAIAYPGLILRYINAELVMKVLKPALELKKFSETDAINAVETLSNFSWLAYKGERGEVWHRKDLRRSMLQLMIAEEPEKIAAIRENAINYFESLKTEESMAEALYHRLMMMKKASDDEAFSLQALQSAYRYINMDLADLPRPANVLLRYASGQTIPNTELHYLPVIYFKEAYHKAGGALLIDRRFIEAYQLYEKGNRLNPDLPPVKRAELLDNWDQETLFSMMEWEQIRLEPQISRIDLADPTLITLLNYLFPLAMVAPQRIDPGMVEALLERLTRSKTPFGNVTFKVNQVMILTRLAVCLAMSHRYNRLTQGAVNSLRSVIQLAHIEEPPPVLQKSLILLNVICGIPNTNFYTPATASLCLDKAWLTATRKLAPESQHPMYDKAAALLDPKSATVHPSRQFLGMLDTDLAVKCDWRHTGIRLKGMKKDALYRLIKGPDPIFRDSCRYALLDAFKTPKDLGVLATLMKKAIPVKVADLDGPSLEVVLSDNPELALEPFIELIDRSWKMESFLRSAATAKPRSTKLKRLSTAYRTWQQTLKKLFTE